MSETDRKVSEWDPTEGRRRALRTNRTALGPTREALLVLLECVSGPLADPYRRGHGPPLGLPDNSSPKVSPLAPTEGSLAYSTPPSKQKGCARVAQKARGTPDRPLAPCGGSGALPASRTKTSNPSSHSEAWKNAIKGHRARYGPGVRRLSPPRFR